jgi:cyclophilin family peptidyl-prolyl cis-trans isomerase
MPDKRRSRTSEQAPPALSLWAGLIGAVIVIVVLGVGITIDWAQRPDPVKAVANCHLGRQAGLGVYQSGPGSCLDPSKTYEVDLETTKGKLTLRLLPKQAPKTASNFAALAASGFYTGLSFFDAQDWEVRAGDPTSTGRGSAGYSLPSEPMAKGESWPVGSVGMARLPDGTVSGSQFFILRTPWSGGQPRVSYNHFATVVAGQDIVSQLTSSDRILRVTVRQV